MKGTYKMTLYNQLFYYKLIPKSTHHPTNKKYCRSRLGV